MPEQANLPAPPKPETVALGLGAPPLMLMPISLFPAGFPDFEPAPFPELDGFAPPPPVPLPFPSGEMATRAARFPCGTSTTGAGGAGAEDNAMTVGPCVFPGATEPISGAGTTSPVCARSAIRGAEPALISRCGLAGVSVSGTMLMSAGRCSPFGRSGAGASVVAIFFTCLGRSLARVCSLISRRGRAGATGPASCTMLGRAGRNLGASIWARCTKVCRGCVGCEGSVKMRWRGWYASVFSAGAGSGAALCEPLFRAFFGISSSGKSSMGPDQVSCVLSSAETCFGVMGSFGQGTTKKTICQRAAATSAPYGIRR